MTYDTDMQMKNTMQLASTGLALAHPGLHLGGRCILCHAKCMIIIPFTLIIHTLDLHALHRARWLNVIVMRKKGAAQYHHDVHVSWS